MKPLKKTNKTAISHANGQSPSSPSSRNRHKTYNLKRSHFNYITRGQDETKKRPSISPQKKKSKVILKVVTNQETFSIQASRPKRKTMIGVVLFVLFVITLLIVVREPDLNERATGLLMPLLEALVLFLQRQSE